MLRPSDIKPRTILKILYMTYDGLTDFIGQSQVLPYLLGTARKGHRFTIVSFEKAARHQRAGSDVKAQLRDAGIEWLPQPFRTSPPLISKILDQRKMERVAAELMSRERFDVVHCRSYPAAVVGLKLKRRLGTPLIFDMRGFWPDSRREGGRWRADTMLGRYLFRRWKKHEADLIRNSDHIVSLTRAASDEIRRWPSYRGAPISIIPCCADFEIFRRSNEVERLAARRELGIAEDARILVYLGSLGTIYRLGEQLRLFDRFRHAYPGARLVFIGKNQPQDVEEEARRLKIAISREEFRLVEAERREVQRWLSIGDAGLCFYTPTFSSLGVSPTKLGEYLACGMPAYCNRGVGDVETLLARVGGGHVLPDFSDESLDLAVADFPRIAATDPSALRAAARTILDLDQAVKDYDGLYSSFGLAAAA